MSTKIKWTNETWNPIIGCSKISEGCQNCYAEKMACRLSAMECKRLDEADPHYSFVIHNGKWNGRTELVKVAFKKPLQWKKPRMIFVCSMGDLFHESVPFEWIDKVIEVIGMCEQHTFQILTKRPERMKEYFEYVSKCDAEMGEPTWEDMPNPNIWLGVTAENQEQADKRIPILLQIPAAKRFVSCEPLLKYPVLSTQYVELLDWVIVGCESGPHRRPCRLEWVEGIVSQCRAAQVPVFVKQLEINGHVEHDVNKFPESVRFQEIPKLNTKN